MKPYKATASSFIDQGNFLCNSCIFFYQAGVYLDELGEYEPEILEAAKAAWDQKVDYFLPEEESLFIPSLRIKYAVMEW